jgi:transcriptional regulator with XRE-family HTH domain
MTVPVEHFLADIGEERRAAIEIGAAEIVAEQQTLAALRRARGLTQAQVAKALETSQANVAQIERKQDTFVSTVARVIRALGAELELNARFADGSVVPLKIGEAGQVSECPHPVPAQVPPGRPRPVPREDRFSIARIATVEGRPDAMTDVLNRFEHIRGFVGSALYAIDASDAASIRPRAEFRFDDRLKKPIARTQSIEIERGRASRTWNSIRENIEII